MSGISAPFGVKKVVIKIDLSPAGGVRSPWNWTAIRKWSLKILGALLTLAFFPSLAFGLFISFAFEAESLRPEGWIGHFFLSNQGVVVLSGLALLCSAAVISLIFRKEIMSCFRKNR